MKRRHVASNPSKVVGYLWVSTEEQTLGPEAQRVAIERWCTTNGAELVAVHADQGISGGPIWRSARARCRTAGD